MLQLLNLARSTPLHGQQEKLEENTSAIKNGVFDVDIDGKDVYSKHTTERFSKSWRTFNTDLNLN